MSFAISLRQFEPPVVTALIIRAMVKTITKPELVTLAVAALGGDSGPVDTEDVAMAAHGLALGAFGWRKYPEQINLELVRVALVDASRVRGGGYVQGSGRNGWVLTDTGLQWVSRHGDRLHERLNVDGPAAGRVVKKPQPRPQVAQRSRLIRSDAYAAWSEGADIPPAAAASLFRVDQYTPAQTRMLKIRNLQSMFAGDRELERFLTEMGTIAAAQPAEGGSS